MVELDMANGLPCYITVGLVDTAVRESRERVSAAVRNSGYKLPPRKITVNLAPAQARKEGTQFDLPIALAVLAASGQVPGEDWSRRYGFLGELALDGRLRPVRGVLAMAAQAKRQGFDGIVVPKENAAEAAATGMASYGASSLREVADFLTGGPHGSLKKSGMPGVAEASKSDLDFADVRGQFFAKRALEIAAAGGHHVLLVGPPGSGKSMMARRFSTLLPELTAGEALEVTRIHSAVQDGGGLLGRRPFRCPHHSSSHVALIGGGPTARPGEVSLAHGGVLFLDELAEFNRPALESLRQPLEDGVVTIARAQETAEYPARFSLVAAANLCPCGWRGHPVKPCVCTPPAVTKYLGRLSGPLLERIDLQVEVQPVAFEEWAGRSAAPRPESSAEIRGRVAEARLRQRDRFAKEDFALNAYIPPSELRRHCLLDAAGLDVLGDGTRKFGLSSRVLDRLLRVGRTIADLEKSYNVSARHLSEAMQYRVLDRLRV